MIINFNTCTHPHIRLPICTTIYHIRYQETTSHNYAYKIIKCPKEPYIEKSNICKDLTFYFLRHKDSSMSFTNDPLINFLKFHSKQFSNKDLSHHQNKKTRILTSQHSPPF